MKLFRSNRKYLAVMGIKQLGPLQKNQLMFVFVRRMLALISLILYAILSLIFLGFEAKTLNEFADSFQVLVGTVGFSLILAIMLWKIDSLFKLIDDFENHIEQRMKNPESKRMYVKLNENIEKWTGIFHFFMVQVTVPAIVMPYFFICFYLYFTTDLGGEAFSLPLLIWTPFDWRTPIGYLIAFTFECSAIFFGSHFDACYIAIFTSSCYVIFTLCDEIKHEIRVLDERSKAGESPAQLMKRVGDIVELHAAAKKLVFDIDNIFALTIIIYFLWSLSTICSTLWVIQMQLEQNADPFELIRPIFETFWSIALIFLICEFGQILTQRFNQLTDAINDYDWTSFPKELQTILPTIIQNTQQEVVLETFKNTSCSRESFKKVVNKGFSYFMVFRKFR